jgi:NitT/TauT family transport system permease protein
LTGKGLVLIAGLLILVLWDLIVRLFRIPLEIVPPPLAVLEALYRGLVSLPLEGGLRYTGGFYIHTFYTLSETLIGWIIGIVIGLIVATILYEFTILKRALIPYINATQALPKLAIAPLFLIWFGLGISSKIALVVTGSFFPVMLNTLLGYESVQVERIDLMRTLGASRLKIYQMILLPSTLPYIFAGVELGLTVSFLSAIAGEFVAGSYGLGYLSVIMGDAMDTPGLFAVLVLMTVLAWASDTGIRILCGKVCFWSTEEK